MNRNLLMISLVFLAGCAQRVERTPSSKTYPTAWIGPAAQDTFRGYSINGIRPGLRLEELSGAKNAGVGEDIFEVSAFKGEIGALLTVDERQRVVLVHTDDPGSLEKDGQVLFRVGDPPELARAKLNAPADASQVRIEDRDALLVVNLNPQGVYSLDLFDRQFYDRTVRSASPRTPAP